jgi:hypothetical protein
MPAMPTLDNESRAAGTTTVQTRAAARAIELLLEPTEDI